MARLWQCGFELNSASNNVEAREFQLAGSATATVGTSYKYSGNYGCRLVLAGTNPLAAVQFVEQTANQNFLINSFRIQFKVWPDWASANDIMFMYNTSYSFKERVKLNPSTKKLELHDEDGLIGTSVIALSLDTWYLIEVKFDITGAAGSHVMELRVNENVEVTSSTRNLSTGGAFVYIGFPNSSPAATVGECWVDDLTQNDNAGSFENSYPNTDGIVNLLPNAAGDASDWANDYTYVDEKPPDNGTTIVTSTTLNHIDDHNIDNTPAAIGSNDTINVVAVSVRCAASTTSEPTFVLRIKASAGGTVEESAGILLTTSTTYRTGKVLPNSIGTYPLIIYDLPGASTTAWTKANLNNAQIGYRLSVDNTGTLRITTVWMSVDYTTVPIVSIPNKILQLNQAVERAAYW